MVPTQIPTVKPQVVTTMGNHLVHIWSKRHPKAIDQAIKIQNLTTTPLRTKVRAIWVAVKLVCLIWPIKVVAMWDKVNTTTILQANPRLNNRERAESDLNLTCYKLEMKGSKVWLGVRLKIMTDWMTALDKNQAQAQLLNLKTNQTRSNYPLQLFWTD